MDAEREYQTQPSFFLVRVRAFATPTYYSTSQLKRLWKELSIRVVQGKPLKPMENHYVNPPFTRGHGPGYTELELRFDAAQIESALMIIEVSSPDGQHVETNFDLDKLK